MRCCPPKSPASRNRRSSPRSRRASRARALLTSTDVLLDLKLDADVIVLSACNTGGAGGRDGGESLSGLARSFFFAGARALMVSHWDMEDQAGAYLVTKTLAGLKEAAGSGSPRRCARCSWRCWRPRATSSRSSGRRWW